MERWRQRVAGLAGWRRWLLSFALGAAAAGALPPLNAIPVLLVSFPGLLWLCETSPRRRDAFVIGWWFGFGHFVIGLYWLANAFLVDADRFAWMIPIAVVGLPAVLAVFPALAVAAQKAIGYRGAGAGFSFAVVWTASEWVRGHVLTGFPWNLTGYSWSFSVEVLQITAVFGIYGLSLITIALACLPATFGDTAARRSSVQLHLAGIVVIVALWSYGHVRLAAAPSLAESDVTIRIVQANIAQADKWKAEHRDSNFHRYLQMSGAEGFPDLIVWPETAAPYFISREARRRQEIAGILADGSFLVTGAPRISPALEKDVRVWNSVVAIDRKGDVAAIYDKVHLVPFGEYLPLRPLLRLLGVDKLVYGPIDYSAGNGPAALRLGTVPPFGPLICYEAIFSGAVIERSARPSWLLNVSNDGWYGISAGPHQHFAMARVRSVEEGLPLVRAANTGISGVVDSFGRVVARIGLDEAGIVDALLPHRIEPETLFGRFGDLATLWLAILMVVVGRISGAITRRMSGN